MCKCKKRCNLVFVLFFVGIAAVFLFSGCRDLTRVLLPEIIEDGGLTDDELEQITNPPGDKELIFVEGTGTLESLGLSKTGATYFIDAANGNDNWDGLSPLTPWRSFRIANRTEFQPGDHILLEANSIWNGTSVNQNNLNTLKDSSEVGMLAPKGSGSYQNHIVIDFYHMEDFRTLHPKVSFRSNQRPIINGNGTPSLGSNRWYPSGAITLYDQHHWRIRNIEVTNTFADILENPNHWYDGHVPKHLSGIFIYGTRDTRNDPNFRQAVDPDDITTYNVIVEQCYVHNVQSMHQNNGRGGIFQASQALGGGTPSPIFKVVGGIIVYGVHWTHDGGSLGSGNNFGYNGMLLQDNIVKKISLEGLRNKSTPDMSGNANSHTVFRGNYIEDIFGDGIVMDAIQYGSSANPPRNDFMNGLVESNLILRSCAAPNSGTANYAAVWAMTCRDTTFQYNEVYGTLYGWNDGEAWDIDIGSDKVIYQFNYSHHNAGGTILFMNSITDGIFRYNISANDGAGTRWLGIAFPELEINAGANSYTRWNNGQSLFHYTNATTSGSRNIPLIYNNTFYIGDGINVGVFGNDNNAPITRYVRFYNNILLKEGDGQVFMAYGQTGDGHPGSIVNPAGFRNNILWAVDRNGNPNPDAFVNSTVGGMTVLMGSLTSNGDGFEGLNGNIWTDPRLQIQLPGGPAKLREQLFTQFPDDAINNPDRLREFTSRERLRTRAGLFTPIDGASPAISAGMHIPRGGTGNAAIDGAWNNALELERDMFESPIDWQSPPIGAAAAPYSVP